MKRSLTIGLLICSGLTALSVNAVPPGSVDEIKARLQPFGMVCRAGEECGSAVAVAASGPLNGQQVYDKFCFACHATGVGDAPLFGDVAAWAERSDKGMSVLMASTLNGLNTMPAKGTCMNCSEDELSEAVTYMLDQAK